METALVLAAVSGVCWALNIIVVRWALPRTGTPPLIGAAVGISVAAVVALDDRRCLGEYGTHER